MATGTTPQALSLYLRDALASQAPGRTFGARELPSPHSQQHCASVPWCSESRVWTSITERGAAAPPQSLASCVFAGLRCLRATGVTLELAAVSLLRHGLVQLLFTLLSYPAHGNAALRRYDVPASAYAGRGADGCAAADRMGDR